MREIDPLREPSEALLSAALHRLGKGAPAGAPGELGASLAQSFRKHHARRRRARVAGWSALAACVILAAVFALKFVSGRENSAIPNVAAQQQQPVQPAPVVTQTEESVRQRAKDGSKLVARVNSAPEASQANQNDGFVPLPSYDPAINTGELGVVRLELSGADLRLVGAPVTEDLSDQRVLADVVVGRDGTPYAVRVVQ